MNEKFRKPVIYKKCLFQLTSSNFCQFRDYFVTVVPRKSSFLLAIDLNLQTENSM